MQQTLDPPRFETPDHSSYWMIHGNTTNFIKFKISSFISYNYIIHYQDIYDDAKNIIIPLMVKPITATIYWELVLTIPKDSNITCEMKNAFQYIYEHYPYPLKSNLRQSQSGGLSPKKRVHFHNIVKVRPHRLSKDISEEIQRQLHSDYSMLLDHQAHCCTDPRNVYSPVFNLYKLNMDELMVNQWINISQDMNNQLHKHCEICTITNKHYMVHGPWNDDFANDRGTYKLTNMLDTFISLRLELITWFQETPLK